MKYTSLELIQYALTRTLIMSTVVFAIVMNLFFLAYYRWYEGEIIATSSFFWWRQLIIIWVTLAGGVIAWLIGHWVSNLLIRHFRENMARIVNFVEKQSIDNLDKELKMPGLPHNDELRLIANTINYKNRQLKDDIQSLQDFIAHVQHEFKTPLASLLVTNELARDIWLTDKAVEKNIMIVKQLNRLLDSLLLLVNRPWEEVRMIDYNIVETIQAIERQLRDKYTDKTINCTIKGKQHASIKAFEWCLENILINLLDNARKYTPNGASVTVKLKPQAIIISDEGMWMEKEYIDRVREPFWQIDKSKSKDKGFGLGLAIVKKYTEKMGWSIKLRSKVGKGSTFTITYSNAQNQMLSHWG